MNEARALAPAPRVLVLLSGSIACIRTASLITALRKTGCEVQVACTPNTLRFIGLATLESLSGAPVYVDVYAEHQAHRHIDLSDWADVAILCPATANTINKLANGIADNTVTNLFLTYALGKKPYLLAPAMNGKMLDHPSVRRSLRTLEEWGCTIIGCEVGRLACGEIANGRPASEDSILIAIGDALAGTLADSFAEAIPHSLKRGDPYHPLCEAQ